MARPRGKNRNHETAVPTNHVRETTTAQESRKRESGHGAGAPESGAKTGGGDGVEIEMRFRTKAGGEAEAGVVLEGLGIGLAVETRSCHVARERGRGGEEEELAGFRGLLGFWLGRRRGAALVRWWGTGKYKRKRAVLAGRGN